VDATVLAAGATGNPRDVKILCDNRPGKRTPFRLFGEAIRAHLAEEHYDIIHSTLPFAFADIYQPRGGSYAEAVVRNIASYENPAVRLYKTATRHLNVRRTVLLNAEKRLCRPGSRTIIAALSEYVKTQFVRRHGVAEERIRVIPNGVDTRYAARADESGNVTIGSLFLFAANNFRLKGLATIVRALRLLRDGLESQPVVVAVAGSGRPDPYRRLAEKLGVSNRLVFLGELGSIQAALDPVAAAVLPTYYDPCSRFILEALAWGKPVITTRFNGAAERYTDGRHGVILDDPRDSRALAKALAWAADADNARAAAQAIRADNLIADISIARHAEMMVELYRFVLANRGTDL